jgi:hypothetical protein
MRNFHPEDLLTPAECLEVDRTLLPYRDKFAARLTIYALRTLKPLAQDLGYALTDLPTTAIVTWVKAQPELLPAADAPTADGDDSNFADWYAQILDAARRPLQQIATVSASGSLPEALTVAEIIAWFEAKAKAELGC